MKLQLLKLQCFQPTTNKRCLAKPLSQKRQCFCQESSQELRILTLRETMDTQSHFGSSRILSGHKTIMGTETEIIDTNCHLEANSRQDGHYTMCTNCKTNLVLASKTAKTTNDHDQTAEKTNWADTQGLDSETKAISSQIGQGKSFRDCSHNWTNGSHIC